MSKLMPIVTYGLWMLFVSIAGLIYFVGSESLFGKVASIGIPAILCFLFYGMMRARIRREVGEKDVINRQIKKEAEMQEKVKRAKSDFLSAPVRVKRIGGVGYSSIVNADCFFGLSKDSVVFVRSSDGERYDIPFSEVIEFEVSGPGKQTTSAGVSGGGFGLEGFIQGAAAAAIINAATSKTTVNTFLRILTKQGELYLHTSEVGPDDLKMNLSSLNVSMANRVQSAKIDADLVTQLEKLQKMMQEGLINQADYDLAKKRLLR